MPPHDLQNIIDQVLVVQKEIATPTDQKKIAAFYDEPPGSVSVFPCFVNLEERGDASEWHSGGRRLDYLIDMHLLFAAAAQKYSVRDRRTWVRPVQDAFGKRRNLAGATEVADSKILGFHFEPVTLGETEYIAVTFQLLVIVNETFEWAL